MGGQSLLWLTISCNFFFLEYDIFFSFTSDLESSLSLPSNGVRLRHPQSESMVAFRLSLCVTHGVNAFAVFTTMKFVEIPPLYCKASSALHLPNEELVSIREPTQYDQVWAKQARGTLARATQRRLRRLSVGGTSTPPEEKSWLVGTALLDASEVS